MDSAGAQGSVAIPTGIYQQVKAWIAHQEAYEAEHNKPAPLTDAQQKALQALCMPQKPMPSLNYVGLLLGKLHAVTQALAHSLLKSLIDDPTEWHQKRPQLLVEANFPVYHPESYPGTLPGGVTTAQVCRVTVAESPDFHASYVQSFPALGYGLKPDGSLPCFANKKAAKNFAASCAVNWLADQGLISLPSSLPPPSNPSQPAVAVAVAVAASAATTSLKRSPQTPNFTISPPSKRRDVAVPSTTDDAVTITASDPKVFELVTKICSDLKFPMPKFITTASSAGPNMFDGRADITHYGDDDALAVVNISAVQGVVGNENTRKAVATKVLAKLRDIEAMREAQLQMLLLKTRS